MSEAHLKAFIDLYGKYRACCGHGLVPWDSFTSYPGEEVMQFSPEEMLEGMREEYLEVQDLISTAKEPPAELTAEAFALQVEKSIVQQVQRKLESHAYYLHVFEDVVSWKPIARSIAVARLKELSEVRITRTGGRGRGIRYNITELANAHFGKKILKGLNFTRRRSLTTEELDQVKAACAKLKLTLPETIEPTTTEQYFAE